MLGGGAFSRVSIVHVSAGAHACTPRVAWHAVGTISGFCCCMAVLHTDAAAMLARRQQACKGPVLTTCRIRCQASMAACSSSSTQHSADPCSPRPPPPPPSGGVHQQVVRAKAHAQVRRGAVPRARLLRAGHHAQHGAPLLHQAVRLLPGQGERQEGCAAAGRAWACRLQRAAVMCMLPEQHGLRGKARVGRMQQLCMQGYARAAHACSYACRAMPGLHMHAAMHAAAMHAGLCPGCTCMQQ